MRRLVALLLLLLVPLCVAAGERPHVYLVVVDGLDARFATPERMPRLFQALGREPERSSFFPAAQAVLPTRTNPNHVSLLTGVYPEAHGITGNAYWPRAGDTRQMLDDAALVEVETLFTVAAEPGLATVGVFAKPKVARLFAEVPGRQRAPARRWIRDQGGGDIDGATMTATLALLGAAEPDFTLVTLAGVDRTAHEHGPEGPAALRAVAAADAAIGRLIDHLHETGRWSRSVLLVTADHGFTAVGATAARPEPIITFARDLQRAGVNSVHLVDDGPLEHVYADAVRPDTTAAGEAAATLARVAEVAAGRHGVVEVLARLPVPGVTPLATAHPDWHLGHERAGDLLLVAAPGYHFLDPPDPRDADVLGNHGGPGERTVPLAVTGGHPAIVKAPAGAEQPSSVDVAPTVAALLGLRFPRGLGGAAVPAALAGHPIAAVLAR